MDAVHIHRNGRFKPEQALSGIKNVVLQPESGHDTVAFGIIAGQIDQTDRIDHIALIGVQIGRGPVDVEIDIGVIALFVSGIHRYVGHFAQGFIQYISVVISVVVRKGVSQFRSEDQSVGKYVAQVGSVGEAPQTLSVNNALFVQVTERDSVVASFASSTDRQVVVVFPGCPGDLFYPIGVVVVVPKESGAVLHITVFGNVPLTGVQGGVEVLFFHKHGVFVSVE
ncbi:MAG: hypothetical protein BWX77_00528 [Bacteroidetes bacterium ADurb.Bin090]|nr:MAG: hypothetical protein BWX77_00528 [Bacteroidetes bacterium ADurb.Bin090]